jgi:hypothetical protein
LLAGVEVRADEVRNWEDGWKMAAWKKKKPLHAAAFFILWNESREGSATVPLAEN